MINFKIRPLVCCLSLRDKSWLVNLIKQEDTSDSIVCAHLVMSLRIAPNSLSYWIANGPDVTNHVKYQL